MIALQTLRPLPARAISLPGESLASLLRRTAETMGYEGPGRIRSLLSDAEKLTANVNLFLPGPSLDRLAELLRRSTEDLLRMTYHRFAQQLVVSPRGSPGDCLCDSKTILKYFVTAASPVCPRCLAEDSTAYERLVWSFRAVPVCATHHCLLVSRCSACRRLLRFDRTDVCRCSCGEVLQQCSVQEVASQAIDLTRVFERLLVDQFVLLPEMSSAATFWWAERLATATAKTPAWMERVARQLDTVSPQAAELLPWLAAAEILTHWPDRFGEFLNVFQQVAKHRTTSTGISRRFGLLLREAAHLEQIGYPTPATALRNYLLRHYSSGHLSSRVALFQGNDNRSLLAKRPWSTQTEAARRLRVRQGTIASLVARRILVGKIHPAGQHGRSVGLVSRESVESLRAELQSALNVCTTARRLGIGRHAVLDLIHADVLSGAVRTAKGWQVPLRSVQDIKAFCASLPQCADEMPDWMSLRQATRVAGPSGLTLAQLVKLMQTGSLRASMADPKKGLNGIAVSTTALAAVLQETHDPSAPSSDWSLHRAEGSLFSGRPVKAHILKRWIRAGLLQARREGRRTMIAAEEIKQFRADYCLAHDAAKILGISRSTLSRWEVQGRIKPVYGKRVTAQAGFSLYRRDDLRRLIETTS